MDFPKSRDENEKTTRVLEYVAACQQISPSEVDYHFFTDSIKELSGAALVEMNLKSEEDPSKTIIKAVSGAPEKLSRLMKIIGFKLEGSVWDANYDAIKLDKKNKLIYFSSFKEIGYIDAMPRLAPVLKIIEKYLLTGDLYAMDFDYQGEFLGNITLFMPKGKKIEDKELIELYISQIAGTIIRLRAENKLQEKMDALRESESKFKAYMENSPLGIFVVNQEGRYTGVNREACQMSGYTEEELLNLSIADVIPPQSLEQGMKIFERLQVEGQANEDILALKKNGETYWISIAAVKIGDQAVAFCQDITDRKHAEESLQHQFLFEKMLADISSTFATQSSDQLEQNITYALEQVGKFFQVDRSYVFQFSDDGKKMSNNYEWCAEGIKSQIHRLQNVPLDTFSWWAEQIRYKKHVTIPDVDILPTEAEAEKEFLKSQGTRSLLNIPMMNNGIVFGFLGIDAVKEKKRWTENQVMLLTVVTELAANAYLRNKTEEKVRYNSLHDGLTGLYNRFFLEKEMERLDTERQLPIGIMMVDLNGFKMVNDTFGHDVGDEMLQKTAEILGNSCRKEDIIARWGGDEFVIFLPQTTEEDAKAIRQRLYENCRNNFVQDIPISMAIGYAIKNTTDKDLTDILKEAEEYMYKDKYEESQRARSTVINVRLKELKTKSYETEDHYAIIQNVAYKIGKEKGLTQSDFDKLEKLITMHDIGKVKIPEEILNKKGPLTAEEWDIVKKHPETGYMIARATEEFAQVAEDILSHREHWDGSGYPQGLKGNEIPLLARIMAIADAYEVMSTGRAYKEAIPHSEIIAELKRCAGTQFDPELIEIFLLKREPKPLD